MTTNQDRAAEALGRERYSRSLQSAPGVLGRFIEHSRPDAQALADAGLLAPDLPEPEMDIDRLIWRVDEEGFVYRKPDGRISTIGVGNPYPSMEIARRHALAVLAATSHYAAQEKK
jgi:hypothetical protein